MSRDVDDPSPPYQKMKSCWRCEWPLPEEYTDSECELCAQGIPLEVVKQIHAAQRQTGQIAPQGQQHVELLRIDWNKVQTFDDLKLVLQTCTMQFVVKGSDAHKLLERFI